MVCDLLGGRVRVLCQFFYSLNAWHHKMAASAVALFEQISASGTLLEQERKLVDEKSQRDETRGLQSSRSDRRNVADSGANNRTVTPLCLCPVDRFVSPLDQPGKKVHLGLVRCTC